jgi:transcriptional regulator with XRE-family HTH domain
MDQNESYRDLREWFTALKGTKEKERKTFTIGELLKIQRKKLDMNQRQLARASGITPATISRLESGQVKELKSEALKRLADALNVTVDYLVGRTTRLNPSDIAEIDPKVEYILRVYEKLSFKRREELRNFINFLEQQENKK